MRYPVWMAKSTPKQSLQALALLHGIGITDGHVQPGDMMFSLESHLDAKPELRQLEGVEAQLITTPISRTGHDSDQSLSSYLCASQPLAPFTNI